MDATRVRFGSILEWLLAAVFIVAAVAAVTVGFRELRTVRAVMPVIAGEPAAYPAAGSIPPRAVSVPMLLLDEGRELRVGDRASQVAARLGSTAQILSESLEATAFHQRITRSYRALGVQFVLVLETFDDDPDARVAAIYVR